VEIDEIENFSYEMSDDNKVLNKKRNLENKIPKETQIEFLKNHEVFNLQDILLKNFLSVKYKFWENEMKGKDIKVGLLDSGVNNKNINCDLIESVNLTNEDNQDFTGHGTYLASVFYHILLIK